MVKSRGNWILLDRTEIRGNQVQVSGSFSMLSAFITKFEDSWVSRWNPRGYSTLAGVGVCPLGCQTSPCLLPMTNISQFPYPGYDMNIQGKWLFEQLIPVSDLYCQMLVWMAKGVQCRKWQGKYFLVTEGDPWTLCITVSSLKPIPCLWI